MRTLVIHNPKSGFGSDAIFQFERALAHPGDECVMRVLAGDFDATDACADAEDVIEQSRDDAQCKIVADAVISNSPVEGIAEYVKSHDIDLVVMGRRGLGALRGMIGSVSFGVLRSVDVPVLTVK